MKQIIFFILLTLFSSCELKHSFNLSSDYRNFPIAVDCEKPSDVNLTYQKDGMPTKKVGANNVTFKIIKNDKGFDRPICIFDDLTLLEFCQYKGESEVGPYWIASYQKINAVKCSEVLKPASNQ
jgi:hypothetical protein